MGTTRAKEPSAREITLVVAQSPRYYPHVARHLGSLRKRFPHVRLLYWEKNPAEPLYVFPGVEVERVVLPFGAGGGLFFLKLMLAFWRKLLRMRPEQIEAIDPYALVPARAYALFARPGGRRARIVYFSMEYFAEMPSLRNKPWKRRVWLLLERWGASGASAAATVCDSIAERLGAGFGMPVATVRNVPARYVSATAPDGSIGGDSNLRVTGVAGLHARCRLDPDVPILVYQGVLQEGRGLEAAIRAVGLVPGLHLSIAGGGALRPSLEALAREADCVDRIHFLGELDFDELGPLAREGLAGLALIEPLSPSYLFALPGKLFEYIQFGVPVVATALPEMRKIIEGYGVGVCMEDYGPIPLSAVFRRLAEDKAWRAGFAGKLKRAGQELCWEEEEAPYLALYP